MTRNLLIVALSIAFLACLYGGVYGYVTADVNEAMKSDRPELEWLRREYQLTDAQFATIREKHEAHDVVCQKLCFDLATAQEQLEQAIANYPEMGPEVKTALDAWVAQRKICREAAIRHMYDVSSVMPTEAAQRYRLRIYQKLILPGRMPHIDLNGEFQEELIEYAAPAGDGRSGETRFTDG